MYSLILNQHTEYPNLFLWVSSVPPGMCQDISPLSLCMFPTPLFPLRYSLLFMRSDGVECILLINQRNVNVEFTAKVSNE